MNVRQPLFYKMILIQTSRYDKVNTYIYSIINLILAIFFQDVILDASIK